MDHTLIEAQLMVTRKALADEQAENRQLREQLAAAKNPLIFPKEQVETGTISRVWVASFRAL